MKEIKMTAFNTPFIFGGLFLRMILATLGFKKASRKLDRFEKIVEEDFNRKDGDDPGFFGKTFFAVGMGVLMVGMGFFTEIYYLCSKK